MLREANAHGKVPSSCLEISLSMPGVHVSVIQGWLRRGVDHRVKTLLVQPRWHSAGGHMPTTWSHPWGSQGIHQVCGWVPGILVSRRAEDSGL